MNTINKQQSRLLHSLLESTSDANAAKETIARFPAALESYVLKSQFNSDILRVIFSTGYIPSESFIYRVCALNETGAVKVLCEFDLFRKVLGAKLLDEDEMIVYAGRKEVADILLEHSIIDSTTHSSLANVWEALKN